MNVQEKIKAMTGRLVEMGVSHVPVNSTIETIQAACCAVFGVAIEDLSGGRRIQIIAYARMASMCLSREFSKASLRFIGKAHGEKKHGTVMHAINRIPEMLEVDKDFRRKYQLVRQLVELNDTPKTNPSDGKRI